MFPLNAVLFPGVRLSLRVFEDRYRALVQHLLSIEEPSERLFGTVAIREGYEVGEHGAQSLYRVGMRLQLTEVEAHPDGTYDVAVLGRDRIRLDRLDTSGEFPVATVTERPTLPVEVDDLALLQARAIFTAYRAAVSHLRGDPMTGALPRDAEYLSWSLAAAAPLPMAERQTLLEADDTGERIALVTDYLRSEVEAMNVIPSLPATEVARTQWSPN
ncbi:LON peptidase substrate-binding domain-containing protein [Nocardioides sp.]|uniref:LON peptidase substrate-binding domain-containing protein n=1 Tax=Nocardioides sp. TaxID=35761 RepID=UPI0026047B5C|nr:LON peptidase substrate-binding domain-containing protein [Nocardioides sp.]